MPRVRVLLPWLLLMQVLAELVPVQARAEVLTRPVFRSVLLSFQREFSPDVRARGWTLSLADGWSEDWANAFTRRWDGEVLISVYGGIARLPGMTAEALTAVLCHELGHVLGGEPFHDAFNELSVEGQADFWGASFCIDRALHALGPGPREADGGLERVSGQGRAKLAALTLFQALALSHREPVPSPDTPDPRQVERTLRTFPETYQCRLDTWLAGLSGGLRPRCWYQPDPSGFRTAGVER